MDAPGSGSDMIGVVLVSPFWNGLLLRTHWCVDDIGLLWGDNLLMQPSDPCLRYIWEVSRGQVEDKLERGELCLEQASDINTAFIDLLLPRGRLGRHGKS